jgi:eukaryotic translation initiation factor 2C
MDPAKLAKLPVHKTNAQELVHFRHLNFNDEPPEQFFKEVPMARRPGFNTTGKEIQVQVNVFPITQFPTKKVYQYDVSATPTDETIRCNVASFTD